MKRTLLLSTDGRRSVMVTQQKGSGRANALRGELLVHLEEPSTAPAEVVYDLLVDVRSHLEWGGERQKRNYRLLSIEAPEGPASIGTEFLSTGADPMGRFADASVVTEVTRPSVFEFVTESRHSLKKGKTIEWTTIHRYQIARAGEGCRVSYSIRTVRISDLPGTMAVFKVPGLRSLVLKVGASNSRKGLRNLVRMAEQRAGVTPADGRRDR